MEDFLENTIDELARKRAEAIDNAIIDFLKVNGYRPKKTLKYMKNLSKRLAKQGKAIKVDELVIEEKFDNYRYYKKVVFIPRFINLEEYYNAERI